MHSGKSEVTPFSIIDRKTTITLLCVQNVLHINTPTDNSNDNSTNRYSVVSIEEELL